MAGIDAVACQRRRAGGPALLAEVQRQAGSCRCFTTGWSWRAGSACGVRMTASGWFDFRSAWLEGLEQGMAAPETGEGLSAERGML